jgi:hypothetical protein
MKDTNPVKSLRISKFVKFTYGMNIKVLFDVSNIKPSSVIKKDILKIYIHSNFF